MSSGLGAELQKAPSLQNARHQLHRSISDLHIVPKNNPFHHHRDRPEKEEKSAVLSLQAASNLEGTKSEGVTPNASRSGSRRTSVFVSADDSSVMAGRQWEKKIIKKGDVKLEREKNALRATELSKSLLTLNTLSHNTTSRLDNTYYSILENVSTLKSTIASLKELAVMTRRLNDDFMKESSEVVANIETQLDGFNNFQTQEQKIENLEYRVETGRAKAQSLGQRVEAVKQRIERWERVEGEWQQRTRKTLKIMWSVTAFVFLILLGLVAFQYTPSRTQGPAVLRGFNISNFTVNMSEIENRLRNHTLPLKRSAVSVLEKLRQVPEEELEEDPRLRAFDEL